MRTKSKPVNEKPPANLEEVKRRFIRQNRELAKNNSSQSLRIRSLEVEVSKLLAQNLDLREQILGLQHELYSTRSQTTGESIRRMKKTLRSKIAELSGLVEAFDESEERESTRSVVERDRVLSPSQRQYRDRQPLAELMQDAIMPTISEDKVYPRRTLDAEDIRAIRLSDQSGTSGSPDLGPPPVARFEFDGGDETVLQIPLPASPKVDEEDLLPSVNLETRRKRKDGGSKVASRRHSTMTQSPVKTEDNGNSTMLRTGAKRKLADRETEKPFKPSDQGDFTFSRKASAVLSSSRNDQADTSEPTKKPLPEDETCSSRKPAKPARKVLGEKSVNASPRKAEAKLDKPSKEESKKSEPPTVTSRAGGPPARGRRGSSIPNIASQEGTINAIDIELQPASSRSMVQAGNKKQSSRQSVAHVGDAFCTLQTDEMPPTSSEDLNPNTPALHEMFSPTTEPLAQGTGGCDTPPPANLSASSNTTEGGQRPSRRARSAVNYAEPSLIAKMRRPDKQMVDAISGIRDPRRTMNPSVDRRTSTGSTVVPRTVIIKREPQDDDSIWKDVPHATARRETDSPLRGKSTERFDGSQSSKTTNVASDIQVTKFSSAATTISSVEAISRKRREQLDQKDSSQTLGTSIEEATVAKKMEELDLYEFKDSSSPTSDANSKPTSPTHGRVSHRRHSSMSKDAVGPGRGGITDPASRSERVGNRRRSMML